MMGVMEDDTNQGIIPRINKQVFSIINNSNKSEIEYTVSVSMIEIYMMRMMSLLLIMTIMRIIMKNKIKFCRNKY